MDSDDEPIIESDEGVAEGSNSQNENVVKREVVNEVPLLSDICLNSISHNFPRFKVAYNTTEDPILQENFQFLQRFYTVPILQRVIKDGHFDKNCFKFLINKHLKEFDISIIAVADYEEIVERISEIGHGLVKVSLCSTLLSQSIVDRIVGLIPNVVILHSHNFCSMETMKNIFLSCPKLEELYLNDCFLGNLNETKLGVLSHSLKVLSLILSSVCVGDLGYLLDSLPNLEIMHHIMLAKALYQRHIDDLINNTLSQVKKYNLTVLDATTVWGGSGPNHTALLMICTVLCPNLKTLSFGIRDENDLELISQFSALENIDIGGKYLDGRVLNLNKFLISHGAKLKRLGATWFEISITTLIQKCPNLEYGSLWCTFHETEAPADNNICLNYFRELSLIDVRFSLHSSMRSVHLLLNSSPNLEKLVISDSEFRNSDINAILSNFCANSILQSITFNCCDVEEVLLKSILLNCSTLRHLVIESCVNICSNALKRLEQISQSGQNAVMIEWGVSNLMSC